MLILKVLSVEDHLTMVVLEKIEVEVYRQRQM